MSGGLAISCSTPLTVSLMRSPASSRARADEHGEHLARGTRREATRVVDRIDVLQDVVGVAALLDARGSAPPSGRRPRRRRAAPSPVEQIATFAIAYECACRRRSVCADQAPGRRVVLDLEHEPARAVAGEEVLDGLGALAALAVGADARAERDQRRAEIAALRAVARRARRGCRRPSRLRAHLAVGDLPREAREQLVRRRRRARRPAPSRRSGRRRRRREARRGRCGGAAARASGFSRPAAISGMRIVPPAKTVMSVAVAEELHRFVGGASERALRPPCRDSIAVRRRPRQTRAGRHATLRRVQFASIDELESALARSVVSHRPRALDGALPLAEAREAAAPRRRGGRRQDRGREGDRAGARRAADPPPVLRGPRRRARRLRVELRAAAAAHPRGAGGNGRRGGALRPRVPDPAAAARGGRGRRSRSCC